MNICFFSPCDELKPYIDRYWSWDSDGEAQKEIYMPVIPPAAGLELFVHYQQPFSIATVGQLPPSVLVFSAEKSSPILPADNVGFIAIRFRAAMFRHFTVIPLAEMNGHYIDMQTIWGQPGKAAFERVSNASSLPEKVCLLEQFLLTQLHRNNKHDAAWDAAIARLYKSRGETELMAFARQMNMSYRHFRRKFIEQTGVAPKQFQQLARFHATIKPLLLGSNKNYLAQALDNGYFDQTHFIKEFKRYLQVTPSAFLQQKNFMSHFYYPSR